MEAAIWDYVARIDDMGGAVAAIEAGFMQDEIEQAAYDCAKAVEDATQVVVGVNRFTVEDEGPVDLQVIDQVKVHEQVERVKTLKGSRDNGAVAAALEDVRAAARGTQNLLVPMREALRCYATLGEVSDVLRDEYGEHRPVR